MNKLYVMCGLPGSGKTTRAQREVLRYESNVKDKIEYISRDEIRFSLIKENEEYFSKEKEVFKTFVQKINSALKSGKDVIADATHISIASRRKLLNSVTEKCKLICLFVDTDLNTCLERNCRRDGRKRVPDESIINMSKNLVTPRYEEGFDEIYYTR